MMNGRIKELLVQSTQESIDGEFATPYVNQEKFAELIVKECGVVAYKTYCQTPGALGIQYKQAIEQHFGVES